MMNEKTKMQIKNIYTALEKTPLVKLMSAAYKFTDFLEYRWYDRRWRKEGFELPSEQEQKLFKEQVTFIYKSFERQKLAIRLLRSIQKYYPGVKVIIADDSKKPLSSEMNKIKAVYENTEVIQLPFNSGLSYGLQCALERVETPYVIRMDDDQMLTRRTQFGKQMQFLMDHPQIDLSGVMQFTTPVPREPSIACQEFLTARLGYPEKDPILPNRYPIDQDHVVVLKGSNVFVAKTEKLKEVGYDAHIRMIDHNDFFCRACGTLVSVIDTTALVHHSHNRFDHRYEQYRGDIEGDYAYIHQKMIDKYGY